MNSKIVSIWHKGYSAATVCSKKRSVLREGRSTKSLCLVEQFMSAIALKQFLGCFKVFCYLILVTLSFIIVLRSFSP